jgi:hypothetical protein
MGKRRTLSEAFYAHPAFIPHRALKRVGAGEFWQINAILTLASAAVLFICSSLDHSLILRNHGYGFLQHPAIYGWFLIQLSMPIAIYGALKRATKAGHCYLRLSTGKPLEFRRQLYEPLLRFVGLQTRPSRGLFTVLFTLGFAGFAWNTFQNVRPTSFAPADFWDSINHPWGYFGTRFYKFYTDALLLPSTIHIFSGIVWTHTRYLNRLVEHRLIRIRPFSCDRAGGMMFLADLILSPAVTALLASGLAFAGAVYVHRAIGVTVGIGIFVGLSVLFIFYILPTALLYDVIRKMKSFELSEIYNRQQAYYDALLNGTLHGATLREAHEQSQFCQEVAKQIRLVPRWPHLTKVFSAFSLGISPTLVLSGMSLASEWTQYFLNRN